MGFATGCKRPTRSAVQLEFHSFSDCTTEIRSDGRCRGKEREKKNTTSSKLGWQWWNLSSTFALARLRHRGSPQPQTCWFCAEKGKKIVNHRAPARRFDRFQSSDNHRPLSSLPVRPGIWWKGVISMLLLHVTAMTTGAKTGENRIKIIVQNKALRKTEKLKPAPMEETDHGREKNWFVIERKVITFFSFSIFNWNSSRHEQSSPEGVACYAK